MNKKVLVLSNNCFSKSGSNGRTLEKFFCDYKMENIAQIYIKKENPDFEFCNKYYCITDKDMMKSIILRKSGNVVNDIITKNTNDNSKSIAITNKTAFKCLVRHLVWTLGKWNSKNLKQWIKTINPDFIFFQAGDSPFMYKIARRLSCELKIPLVFYNTEGYIFKGFNYIEKRLKSDSIYSIYHYVLKKQYEKTLMHSIKVIYNCEKIKLDSDNLFNKESEVIMTSSSNFDYDSCYKPNTFCYTGNLGVGRAEALILLGESLYKMNKEFHIDIYGKATENMIDKFKTSKGVNYCGFVDYKQIYEIYHNNQFIVHVESFDAFYIKDLEYAFSTKIADLLACNRTIISFSPDNCASANYFKKYNSAFQINSTNLKDIEEKLKLIINDNILQTELIKNAKYVSKLNHNEENIMSKFNAIVESIFKDD